VTSAQIASSGKTHRDENFPVASWLIVPRQRPLILAFYRFVRAADDVADHASLPPETKLAIIDRLECSLLGREDSEPTGLALRTALAARQLSPRHALDLLSAFRLDVTKRRYADWKDLMDYCALSAVPVGRFVLDAHGESRSTWPASDALCAALQVINHLQDCGADYRNLDRVYIPLDAFAAVGLAPEALAAKRAPASLLRCIAGMAERAEALLAEAAALSGQVADGRLAIEIAVIHRSAVSLAARLKRCDPLAERVHMNAAEFAAATLLGIGEGIFGRWKRRPASRRALGPRP
jgi:hydroxysqualene synthase